MKNKSKRELQMYFKKQKNQGIQKYFRKKRAQEAGITLIALVVTIIILLILAGVSLSAVSNQGLIAKAKEASDIYSNAQKDEEKAFSEIEEALINKGETYELTINKDNAYLIGYEKDTLEELNIPEKVEMDGHVYTVVGIEANTFTEDSKLKKVTIANTVTTIGRWVLTDCSNLEEIYVPANTTNIGSGFTQNSTKLKKIEIDEANTRYKDEDGAVMSKDGKILIECPRGKDYTNWTIPESVEELGRSCLLKTNIQTLTIHKKITKIGYEALKKCTSLKSLVIDGDIEEITSSICAYDSSLEKVKINGKIKKLRGFYQCTALKEINIPDTVEELGGFWGCRALENFTIPSNIKKISDYAFFDCSNIKISFSNYKNLKEIGEYAFPKNSIMDENAKAYILSINNLAIGAPSNMVGGDGDYGYNYEI